MKVFVTGASGYIGSSVAARLARHGHEVHGLIRNAEHAPALAALEINPVIGDLGTPASFMDKVKPCGAVIHCAAEYSERFLTLDRSVSESILSTCQETNLPRKFIYTSGVWVYGDTGYGVRDEASSLNPYPPIAGRVDTERFVLSQNRSNLQTIVLRPGCVYGGSKGLTTSWFVSGTSKGGVEIIGDGSNRWAMIHVEDLAELYRLAAESSVGGEVFNATDRSRFSVRDCAEAAARAAGIPGKVSTIPVQKARETLGWMADAFCLNQHIDSSKATRVLGWVPRHAGFVDGVDRYYRAWESANQ